MECQNLTVIRECFVIGSKNFRHLLNQPEKKKKQWLGRKRFLDDS